jgi:hypothetical protein
MYTHEDAVAYLSNWLKMAESDLQNALVAVQTALDTQDQLDIRNAISQIESLEGTRAMVERALRKQLTTGGLD